MRVSSPFLYNSYHVFFPAAPDSAMKVNDTVFDPVSKIINAITIIMLMFQP